MKATLTSKGQITLPVKLRRQLSLKSGDVLEFDETTPYLKAHKPFNEDQMDQILGRGKSRTEGRTSSEWIDHLRGPLELP
ncbi:MAG: AbrB/MazE/SpoVT family DNA-binding domain-containing protein [Verrucomicrobiota bacterium]